MTFSFTALSHHLRHYVTGLILRLSQVLIRTRRRRPHPNLVQDYLDVLDVVSTLCLAFHIPYQQVRLVALVKDYVLNQPMDPENEGRIRRLLQVQNKRRATYQLMVELGDLKLDATHRYLKHCAFEFELFLDGKIEKPTYLANVP